MRHQRGWLVLTAVLFLGCPTGGDDDDATDDDAADDDSGNLPPTAPVVEIQPASPHDDDDLTCVVTHGSTDPDGDAVDYTVEWLRNGSPVGITTYTVPASETALGEKWTCAVTPNDGLVDGPTGTAQAFITSNGHIGIKIEMAVEATGGPAGGPAITFLTHSIVDSDCNTLCHVDLELDGVHAYSQDQGDDFWWPLDQIVTWTSGQETANDCPPQWAFYKGDPAVYFLWDLHPIAVVGCEQVAQDPALAATFVGDDPLEIGDGTLGDYCAVTGPDLQAQLGSGPVEGVWLAPGLAGSLDALGDYAYFPPADTTNVEVWMLMGLMMATVDNGDEPTIGLEGMYLYHPFWHWMYGNPC